MRKPMPKYWIMAYLRKPTPAATIHQSLDWMCSIRGRLRKLKKAPVSGGQNAGNLCRKPSQIGACRGLQHDGIRCPPIYRKAGHGSLRHPAGNCGRHFAVLQIVRRVSFLW